MESLIEYVVMFIPLVVTALVVLAVFAGVYWMLLVRWPGMGSERKLPRQLAVMGVALLGVIVIALALPVSESTRNQVIALIGVLVSGVIAFSSTTIVANFMGGMMLRITMPYRVGDFIRVDEYFGRVAERGLLDTEIQTESRELVSLPNTYLITHPVTVVRASGVIISITLSVGYDIHHSRAEALLLAAAREAGLEDPFVQIVELGNHAVSYRINGLLTDVKSMISVRSNLHRVILDVLHGDGIEMVSPSFVNQRQLAEHASFLPTERIVATSAVEYQSTADPEQIVFDKAEEAEQREQQRRCLQDDIQELEARSKEVEGAEKRRIAESIAAKREQIAALENGEQGAKGKSANTTKPDDRATPDRSGG